MFLIVAVGVVVVVVVVVVVLAVVVVTVGVVVFVLWFLFFLLSSCVGPLLHKKNEFASFSCKPFSRNISTTIRVCDRILPKF